MKLFLRNYFLLALITLLTLFSCVEKSTTDSNSPPTPPPATSLAIDYGISGNFYIALTNTALELIQKGNFGSQSNFSISPTLPNGLSLDITNGNISGTPTNFNLPTDYTVTATKDNKTYTKTVSLGVAPSITWVTDTNSLNPYQLTSYVVGDRSKQISDWTWSSSDRSLATVTNGMISFESTTTGSTVFISASKNSYSNGVSFSIDKVEEVNGEEVITEGANVRLFINSNTKTVTNSQFENKELTSVIIPNSVTYIGNSAFQNNPLTNLVIPNSITNIGNLAFYNNQLTSLVIPDSVTNIGNNAFYGNPNLLIVSLKQSLYTKIINTSSTNAVFGSQVTNYIKRP